MDGTNVKSSSNVLEFAPGVQYQGAVFRKVKNTIFARITGALPNATVQNTIVVGKITDPIYLPATSQNLAVNMRSGTGEIGVGILSINNATGEVTAVPITGDLNWLYADIVYYGYH